ncbi:hypothetical protein OAN307_c08230 [Octadecabacter antarcticus 307]|uniref:Uncharacterized protein n=1 Tax=Octadecabacter antarcticus 307 TaxID=391626 RepID=M9R888_9RHOB|nr:hypothetical protein OAN307_c08230 [Octadecabacter antarcticus 307]
MMENLSALEPRYTVLCPERTLFDEQNGTWFMKTIRASGQVIRANSPDTRPHLTNINRIRNVLLSRSHPHRTKCEFAALAKIATLGTSHMPFITTIGRFLCGPLNLTCQHLCEDFHKPHYISQSFLMAKST